MIVLFYGEFTHRNRGSFTGGFCHRYTIDNCRFLYSYSIVSFTVRLRFNYLTTALCCSVLQKIWFKKIMKNKIKGLIFVVYNLYNPVAICRSILPWLWMFTPSFNSGIQSLSKFIDTRSVHDACCPSAMFLWLHWSSSALNDASDWCTIEIYLLTYLLTYIHSITSRIYQLSLKPYPFVGFSPAKGSFLNV